MCGIGVVLGPDSQGVQSQVEVLMGAMAHRGPDGAGFRSFLDGRLVLGHRRLSIVDLEGGAQPMCNADGTVWVTFNGEIYNHLDLRRQLEHLGHRFATRSDTEVLVHGFTQWGTDCFRRLNGIFAYVLLDLRTAPRLYAVRDPLGVKPLYLGRRGHTWWVSSELAAAKVAGLVEAALRPDAVAQYLVYRFVPAPLTMHQGAWKLPAGHYTVVDPRAPPAEPVLHPVGDGFAPSELPRTRGEWQEELRAGLAGAVHRQLMSDVPVGVLLSGGVDSTVVAKLMSDHLPAPPVGFAIGFPQAGADNEIAVARRAAAALHMPLVEAEVTAAAFQAAWVQQVQSLGEPVANTGAVLVALLCQRVRATHKVVLAGQGADEPLGGYARHTLERVAAMGLPLQTAAGFMPEGMFASDRVARAQRILGEAEATRRFAQTFAVVDLAAARAMTRGSVAPEVLLEPVARRMPHVGSTAQQLLQVDARLCLADDLLLVADHTSMASSVELRVPFLDLALFALLERMPLHYKVSWLGERKWLYRRAVRRWIPAPLRKSLLGLRARVGRKWGFSTPLDAWYGPFVRQRAARELVGPRARLPDVVDPRAVLACIDQARAGLPRQRQMVLLYTLEQWLRGLG